MYFCRDRVFLSFCFFLLFSTVEWNDRNSIYCGFQNWQVDRLLWTHIFQVFSIGNLDWWWSYELSEHIINWIFVHIRADKKPSHLDQYPPWTCLKPMKHLHLLEAQPSHRFWNEVYQRLQSPNMLVSLLTITYLVHTTWNQSLKDAKPCRTDVHLFEVYLWVNNCQHLQPIAGLLIFFNIWTESFIWVYGSWNISGVESEIYWTFDPKTVKI